MYTPAIVVAAVFLSKSLSVQNYCCTSLSWLHQRTGPVLAGLFCLMALTGCQQPQPAKTPEQITTLFWSAMADNDLACLLHGYLHRVEGDSANAAYWYRRADTEMPDNSLDEEFARPLTAMESEAKAVSPR